MTISAGRRPHRLPDVFVRPALDGKRLAGELEVHSNGVRYQSPLGQKIGSSTIALGPTDLKLRISAFHRSALQQYKAFVFSAVRRGDACDHPFPLAVAHNDWEKEGQGERYASWSWLIG